MVISNDYPGLTAEVIVDGYPLQEYDNDEDDKPSTITKYIEASSDKDFALSFRFSPPFSIQYGVEIGVSIDGERARLLTYQPKSLYKPEGHWKMGVSCQRNGEWFRQNYRFTALNIVEEVEEVTNSADLRNALDSKGSIKLSFRFVTNMRRSSRPHTESLVDILPVMGAVPEKALKGDARSHQATLGEPQPIRRRRSLRRYHYVDREPFATFNFKYRSLSALKALRVIDDHHEDEVAELLEEMPEDEITPDQSREDLRRARREALCRNVKQENSIARNIKREYTDMVDLTGDNDELVILDSRQKRLRGDPEVIVLD